MSESVLLRQAEKLAANQRRSVAQVLADLRRVRARMRWLDAAYPPPKVRGGLVDLEPNLRRLAIAEGMDADELVRDARRIVAEQSRRSTVPSSTPTVHQAAPRR